MPGLLARTSTLLAACAVLVLAVARPAGADSPGLEAARRDADAAAAEVADARGRLATAEDEVVAVGARIAALESELEPLRAAVQARAVERFVSGGDDPSGTAQLLLRGEGIDEAVRADVLARTVTAQTDAALEEYVVLSTELARSQRELLEARATAEAALAAVDRRAMAAAGELVRQVELEGERLQAAGVRGDSGFLCPVDGPHAFTNDWGQARSGGRRHRGTDMLSPRGTPVVASVAGTVEGHSSALGGTSYTLTGDDGTTYYGTHLASLTRARGRVERGTVLGHVGNSGNARGGPPHLHFEIRPGGRGAINPYPTLAERC